MSARPRIRESPSGHRLPRTNGHGGGVCRLSDDGGGLEELIGAGASSTVVSMGSPDHEFHLAEILSQNYGVRKESEEAEGGPEKSEEELEKDCMSQSSDMPLDELLALYGYEPSDPISERESEGSGPAAHLPDMTLDKEQIAKDLLSGEEEEETQSLADDLTPSVTCHEASDLFPSQNELSWKCLTCSPVPKSCFLADADKELGSSTSSDVEDPLPANKCKKEIMVGPQFQADLSHLQLNRHSEKIYENEDQLLWDPSILPEREVEEFLYRAVKRRWHEMSGPQLPDGEAVRDSEQALYELVKCNFNAEEALRRLRFNVKVIRDGLCAWSEEECRNFEHGFRVHGKNFHLIQANKPRMKDVGRAHGPGAEWGRTVGRCALRCRCAAARTGWARGLQAEGRSAPCLRAVGAEACSRCPAGRGLGRWARGPGAEVTWHHPQVRTRSVGECVEYYYLWKKSERYEYFSQQTRLGRRKCGPPGATDADQDLDSSDPDGPGRPRCSPPLPPATDSLGSEQDPVARVHTESLSVDSTAGSLSKPGDGAHGLSSSEPGPCPFQQLDTSSAVPLPQRPPALAEPAFCPLAVATPEPSTSPRLAVDLASPGVLPEGLPLLSSQGDVSRGPEEAVAPTQVALSVTEFGLIGIGDVNPFLAAHPACPAPGLHAEPLSHCNVMTC
ncbi:hypothetical protein MC885_002295 [Smutsia gigantea]|nr:hypothetical protein MC885_002295 [Smutsia gigantea]